MYFNFACPHCGKKLRVQEEQAGRNARCPYCKGAVVVPDPQAIESEEVTGAAGSAFGSTGGTAPGAPVGMPASGASTGPAAGAIAAGTTPPAGAGVASSLKVNSSVARKKGSKGAGRQSSHDDGTNVSLLLTAALGGLLTAAFYGILLPVPKMYFRDLFFDRGWVTLAETFLMFWAIAILIFKSRKLVRQRESMLLDLLPESFGRDIRLENVAPLADYVRGLPVDTRSSFLTRRVLRGLEHYSVRGSASEVSTMLSSQAELDNNAVASSYSLLNVFIWAIPILGFIGTVQGLGNAVGNLSGSLEAASDVESIKKSLGAITGGLGVAFDTTLVALIMSLFLKFPASSLQKAEEDLLNWVEDYCNENLLKRLVDTEDESPDAARERELRAAVQNAIHSALIPHQAELRSWNDKLREIGQQLTGQVLEGWSRVHEDLQTRDAARLGEITTAVRSLAEATTRMATSAEQWAVTQQSQVTQSAQEHADQMRAWNSGHEATRAALEQTTRSFDEQLSLVRQAVENLNEVLGQLDGKQVVVQQAPRRRGWFG